MSNDAGLLASVSDIGAALHDVYTKMENALAPVVSSLDPSLFQNVLLAILAIFIPFAIVFLTETIGSERTRSEFEKRVLSVEVLGAAQVFWAAIFGMAVLAFFHGEDLPFLAKLSAFVFVVILVAFLAQFFLKTLRFSAGHKSEFELRYLGRLRLRRFRRRRNKKHSERMRVAWCCIWSDSVSDERAFVRLFVKHVDSALLTNNYQTAVDLGKSYIGDADSRDIFSMGQFVFPKALAWNEALQSAEAEWLEARRRRQRVMSVLSRVGSPNLQKMADKLLDKFEGSARMFWQWDLFKTQLIPVLAARLVNDAHGRYQLFERLKEYADEAENVGREACEGSKEGRKLERWNEVLISLCPQFFDTVPEVPDSEGLWEYFFPGKWKVRPENSESVTSRIWLYEFIKWADARIMGDGGVDSHLSVIFHPKGATRFRVNGATLGCHFRARTG